MNRTVRPSSTLAAFATFAVLAGCQGMDPEVTELPQALCPTPGCPGPEVCDEPRPVVGACRRARCAGGAWIVTPSPANTPCRAGTPPATVDGACDGVGGCRPLPPCPGGTTRCGLTCADLTADPASCGACGTSCGPGGSCQQGRCYPTPESCGPCTGGGRTCCLETAPGQAVCRTEACVPPLPTCEPGALCSLPGTTVCGCPSGQTCAPRCGPRICEVNALLCLLFPPLGCLPQCSPGLCSIDSFCQ
jgi:hypothetical protein